MSALGREHHVEAAEVHPLFPHPPCQSTGALERFKDALRRAFTVRRLQLLTGLAIRHEQQALFEVPARNGRSLG